MMNWHKGCFHCEVCKMTLNMNNYKGYEKKPYCNAHYPKQTFTIVTDTPENLRLRQQSELQSQVKYRKDFEQSKGRGLKFVLDTPELQRLRKAQDQISNAKYHKDFEVSGLHGVSQGTRGSYPVRAQMTSNHETVGNSTHKGVHQYIMEMDRRPGVIVGKFSNVRCSNPVLHPKKVKRTTKPVYYLNQNISTTTVRIILLLEIEIILIVVLAPVLPGAYYPSGHSQGHSYMHQTSMHSLRSQHRGLTVYRALYDYTAQDYDEVSFRDGDIIQNVQPIDEGWMYGTVQRTGKSGMLPANYVEGIR
ncbi:LIM zinc-binding domain-containing Nebulette-like isoform X2 [Cyprinus carpio]|uniref:LIM zinc-binding domain-containing Nebulette-like isoform X2 n=1 Tax=Cyprinus carpio TaxID=7962 RepID=A0A9R0BAV4_CYPCA|nr:LIM zinc-binding domain-containing Nebulette-like isoform X2 [Cyprinus carpio]